MPIPLQIDTTQPFIIREEIKRVATLMEIKLRVNADRDGQDGLVPWLQRRPGDTSANINQLEEGIIKNLNKIQAQELAYNQQCIDSAVDIMNYAMMICSVAWNAQQSGILPPMRNSHDRAWQEIQNERGYPGASLEGVTEMVTFREGTQVISQDEISFAANPYTGAIGDVVLFGDVRFVVISAYIAYREDSNRLAQYRTEQDLDAIF